MKHKFFTISFIYAGEAYDARREIEDWCKASTPAGVWRPAQVTDEHTPPYGLGDLCPP